MNRTWTIALTLTVLVLACDDSGRNESSTDAAVKAQKILEAARNRLGGAAVERFKTVRAEAKVESPNTEFVTVVWSARDGRARMEQTGGFTAGAHPAENWRIDGATGEVVPLDDRTLAFVRGHELHAAVLVPESRYHDPEFIGGAEFGEQQALVVSLLNQLGDSVFAYYSAADTVPLGFRMMQPDPDVVVTLGEWEWREDVLVFTHATFLQAEESFRYEYVDIQFSEVPDSVFMAPSAMHE